VGDCLSPAPTRVLGVDWSGRRVGAARAIWLAEARGDELVRLEDGRSRDELCTHLLELADDDPGLVVGFDFSFSLPAWFLRDRGHHDVAALWAAATADGDDWIARCEPPFWGRPGTRRPPLPAHLRTTEETMAAVGGIRPRSTFQVSGAGSVGAGSIRGFPVLARLRAAGWAIWPFDAAAPPVAIEVWPRAFSGPVVKSRADARAAHLSAHAPGLRADLRAIAVGSEDAFDAAVTALGLVPHAAAITALPATDDDTVRLEGAIWCPTTRRAQASAASRRASDESTTTGSSCVTSGSSTK
jgi:hypothetical protein